MEKQVVRVPALEGSEKQVEWAKKIRKAFITVMGQARPDYVQKELAHVSAGWWIENRFALGITNQQQAEINRLARG